jgi:hypothetical protein
MAGSNVTEAPMRNSKPNFTDYKSQTQMGSNILEERMLQDTLGTLRHENESTISPAQGVMLIDGWLQALQGEPNLNQLEVDLNELRVELQGAQPNDQRIRELMLSLADKTQSVAEGPYAEGTWTGGLESLSKILRSFGNNL